ncbi:MAG: GTP 3',8-cyclase MoaA [Planctomycetota bacterium]
MKDRFGREINYLRISITDRCNFRCFYCMPPAGIKPLLPSSEILSYEEILEIVKTSTNLGITNFRITGGEPLVRKDIISLLQKMRGLSGVESIALTTNGYLIDDFAEHLSKIGLYSINIGLNSFNRDNFKTITGIDGLNKVRKGIRHILETGFSNLKINTVLLKDYNEEEVIAIAKLTLEYPVAVRFIEYMPCGNWETNSDSIIKGDEIIKRISGNIGELTRIEDKYGSGPAQYYRLPNAPGKIGFIMPVSHFFCADCNRIRLTADGHLKSCLLSEEEIDLKPILREIKDKRIQTIKLNEALKNAILAKPERHLYKRENVMSRIGG